MPPGVSANAHLEGDCIGQTIGEPPKPTPTPFANRDMSLETLLDKTSHCLARKTLSLAFHKIPNSMRA